MIEMDGQQDSNGNFCKDAYGKYCGVSVRTVAFDAISKNPRTKYRLWDYVGERKGREIVKANVSLIRTIEESKFPLIVRGVVKCFKEQMTRDELIEWIEKVGGVDTTRAEIIADDQIGKATVRFQIVKWKDAGWKRVMWKHSRGVPEPREYHIDKWDGVSGKKNGKPNALNGFVFDMDKPPVIDKKTGERGYPAQLINCRCYLVPYD